MGSVTYDIVRAFLAQSVERAAFNRKVVGSRPTGGVFYNKDRRVRKRERRKTADGAGISRYLQDTAAYTWVVGSSVYWSSWQ